MLEKYYYGELKKLKFNPTVSNPTESPQTISKLTLTDDEPLISPHPVNTVPDVHPVEMEISEKVSNHILNTEVTTVHHSTVDELRPLVQPLGSPPKNPKFIFHNKIPKAGSTTMKWLLVALANKNKFHLDHVRPCIQQETCGKRTEDHHHWDGPDGEEAMKEYLPEKLEA